VGAEALVRWRHPVNGLMSPTRFIPMAEETGLILPLGRYVLDAACRQVRSIRDRLAVDLPISVNLSPRQFQESGLAIDDFGTGHSSLAYLKQFPVQEVKVDRSFVQGIAESPVDSAIVRAVIAWLMPWVYRQWQRGSRPRTSSPG
jgi:EAL domain-containing protein (putative c-di-GMP-specific phosphodiesterase class I)